MAKGKVSVWAKLQSSYKDSVMWSSGWFKLIREIENFDYMSLKALLKLLLLQKALLGQCIEIFKVSSKEISDSEPSTLTGAPNEDMWKPWNKVYFYYNIIM